MESKRPRPGSDADSPKEPVGKKDVDWEKRWAKLLERMEEFDNLSSLIRKVLETVNRQEEEMRAMNAELERQRGELEALRKEKAEWRGKLDRLGESMKRDICTLREKAIDSEARSRRNNVVMHGVKEEEGEDCKKKLVELLQKAGMTGTPVIERAHRLGRKRGTADRPIIARFLDFNDRMKAMNAKRNLPKGIYCNEDLPLEIRLARQTLQEEVREAKAKGHQAWVAYPARLVVNGQTVRTVDPSSTNSAHSPRNGVRPGVSYSDAASRHG